MTDHSEVTQELLEEFSRYRVERSLEAREHLVRRICEHFRDADFTGEERSIVEDILTFLSKDVEKTIRRTLAETLKSSSDLPKSIAVQLAEDIEEVSTPILQFSTVLDDDDLERIILSTEEVGKLKAIAKRDAVSERISGRLVEKGDEDVASDLVANDGAKFTEGSLQQLIEQFEDSQSVLGSLVKRSDLSVELAERLVSVVSGELQKSLVEKYGVDPEVIKKTVQESREKVTVDVISGGASKPRTHELVTHLHKTGKLTHSIVLRALCRGDMDFFVTGMAKLAGIPLANAKTLVYHGDSRGFEAIFRAASMPEGMLQASEILMRHVTRYQEEHPNGYEERDLAKNLMSSIVENGYDKEIPNMSYMLALISNDKPSGS